MVILKRRISILLLILMLLSVFGTAVFADEEVVADNVGVQALDNETENTADIVDEKNGESYAETATIDGENIEAGDAVSDETDNLDSEPNSESEENNDEEPADSPIPSGVKKVGSSVQKIPRTFKEQFPIVFKALNTGFLQTLKLFALTLAGAIPLGLIIAFGTMSKFKPLSYLCKIVVWIIRGTPLMIQVLIIYYMPGLAFGNPIWGNGEDGRFLAATISFIINYACYFSEIYRGGIQGVPKGQQEAGQVLGMSKGQIFFRITLLQMIKRILPPMANEIITLVKDTSLARIIAMQEIIWAGEAFMTGSFGISGQIWPLFFTALYYLVFSGVLTILFDKLEKKLDYFRG